jgi:putative intracellular protease/amidase
LLPEPTSSSSPPLIADAEVAATLTALSPPKRQRPLIAIVGINDATETTDYLMPYGVLRRADVADVLTVSTQPGPVRLFPALTVLPDTTIADFDARHPSGADYLIVPAMSREDDPAALAWIRAQADRGAIVIGICVGAKVVANAGLLDGRKATTHWYFLDGLLEEHPTVQYVPDRRLVVDRDVATTTGITASMPMMLTLIESIAGTDKAHAVASELGVTRWDARHDSAAFTLTRPFARTVVGNLLAFWRREQIAIELEAGVDEISIALVADAWSRTYRSRAVALAPTADPVLTRGGIRMLPDLNRSDWQGSHLLPSFASARPAEALDRTLDDIANRYGSDTAQVVAMQLEYPTGRLTP